MAKFDIQAFFNNIEGKTWSLGSAFKRADALPLDLYSVWKTKAEAEAYAASHATAYPGQILVVVEKENEVDVIKLYYIDESRTLQEVGSATLGDEKTIVLDPESKILSIKGFEKAGFAKTSDEKAVANKEYFTVDDNYNYVKVENVEVDSDITSFDYYERIAVKLIKDSAGNLSWITDDAVQIQGNIAALQTAVSEHTDAIDAIEENIEAIDARITSLGTVFNFKGEITVGVEQSIYDVAPVANYKAGDVVLVNGTQEYVCIEDTEGEKTWQPFGDPTGVAGIEARVDTLEGTATTHSNAIGIKTHQETNPDGSGKVDSEGKPVMVSSTGLYLYAEQQASEKAGAAVTAANGYTDNKVAEVKAIADANALEINGKAAEGNTPAVEGLKEKVAKNTTAISNLNTTLNGKTPTDPSKPTNEELGVIGRVTKLENESAKASVLDALDSRVDALSQNLTNNYSTSATIASTYETIENVNGVKTNVASNTKAIQDNANAISTINVQLNGANGEGGLAKTVNGLVSTTEGHGTKISAIEGKLDVINGTGSGSIAEAKAAADLAKTAADNAQKDATQALKDAAAASQLAGTKATLADVAGVGYALDVDAKKYAKDVQGNTNETVASAHALASEAKTAAGNAQSAANAAQGTANEAVAKFAEYTNTTGMNAAIAAVVGKTGDDAGKDTKDDITVKGTRLYAKDLADGLQTSINNINTALVDLTTVMNFIGVFETLPAANSYHKGDVCIVGTQEYVLVESIFDETTIKSWEPFGTVTADAARFEEIEKVIGTKNTDGSLIPGAVGTLLKDVDDLQTLTGTLKETSDNYATRFTNAEGRIKVVEDDINTETTGIKARLTAVEGVAGDAATDANLQAEIQRATGRENEIAQSVTDGFAAQGTKNTELQGNIDAIYKYDAATGLDSGLLTWGTF